MTSNSLFKDIAKQVHPDVNGGSVNATKMMQEAIKHRNNGDMLLNLARKWGLKLNGTFDDTAFNKRSSGFSEEVFEVVVGAIIEYTFNHNRKRHNIKGVVINIRPITKGRFKGAKEYSVYDFRTQVIWKHKDRYIPDFKVVGKASQGELQLGQDTQDRIKESKKVRSAFYQSRADNKFSILNLQKSKDYRNSNLEVLVNYKTGLMWRKLVRTTAKCAFVEEWAYSKEHMIKIGSVMDTRRM